MSVALSVVTDKSVPPELIGGESDKDRVGVVDLVVIADPCADQAPHGLPGRVSAQTRHLSGLATYKDIDILVRGLIQ